MLVVHPLIGHTTAVTSVAFSSNGTQLVSWSVDHTLRLWDVKSGRLILGPLKGPEDWILFVAFSPNGQSIISVSMGGDASIWDAVTGACVSSPSMKHKEGSLAVVAMPKSTYYCAISPNGKWLAHRASDYKAILVIDSKSGLLVATLRGHTGHVHSVSFSPDSKCIISSSDDRTIQVHTFDF